MTAGTLTYDTKLDTNNFNRGLNSITDKTRTAGSTIKNIVAGLGITKIIASAISTINNSIDGAISRYDTMNNFPKVMENLGISSEEAQKSVDKMSEKLAGLPTTLDQGVSAVQRFTSANNDVEKSTDIFLALNNAIIAGGASSETQASALEQLSQAYAKGKPDMQEWRTIMTAMPAQMQQVAKSMGYINAEELGEALRQGEISMDDFTDEMIKLNEEGIEGFANFEDQARSATGGIGTAITVAKTQVVKGVTDIISAIDEVLEKAGIGKIGTIIANVGKKAKEALDLIASLIKGEISPEDFTKKVLGALTGFLGKINNFIPTIMKKGKEILEGLVKGMIESLPELINVGIEIINNISLGIADMLPTLIPLLVDLILKIADTLLQNLPTIIEVGIQVLMKLIEGIMNALPKLISYIPTLIKTIVEVLVKSLPQIIKAGNEILIGLINGILDALPDLIAMLPEIIMTIVTVLIENLPYIIETGIEILISLINGIIEAIPKLIEMLPMIIVKIVSTLMENMPQIVQAGVKILVSLVQGIVSVLGKIGEAVWKIHEAIWNKISEIINKAKQWGKDLIQGFINGILGMLSNVGNAAKSIANRIKSYLHFSKPDIGPLREYEKWMPDMIKGLAKSMEKSSNILYKQSKEIAEGIKDSFDIDYTEDMYKQLENAVNKQVSTMSFSGVSGSVTQILSANAQFEGTIPIQVDLDGEKIYDNQQKVQARKNLQYGGVR